MAAAKSINRCQFETGFSLRGEVWVAFWNYGLSTQRSRKEHVVRPHFLVSFLRAFIVCLRKFRAILFNLMYNKHL